MKDDDMSVLATDERQFTLIYSSDSSIGKQTLGYVQSVENKIHTVDISKTKIGDTVWVTIAEELNKPLHALLWKELPDLPDVNTSDFDTNDWLKLLNKNPALLQKPIAINGKKYMQVETPSQVLKFFGADTSGLDKKPLGKEPSTKPKKSDRDTFV